MAYWWVNQNQTAKHEIEGGYMWSPRRNQNNAYNQFYENMRFVEPGDVVFSFVDQRIHHVGIVQRTAVSGNKPEDFGLKGDYWSNEGWFVPIVWHRVPLPIRPKALIDELRPFLPEKYSPLNRVSGDGLQSVYLARVPDGMASVLLQHLGDFREEVRRLSDGQGDEDGSIARLDDAVESMIRNNTEIDATEKEAVVNARRGQGRFRLNVEAIETRCRVTGVTDRRLLRASHIKPWRSCPNNHERLDGHNGFLLAPHIDHLFDRGYISFDDDGQMVLSQRIGAEQITLMGLRINPLMNVGAFTAAQRAYLAFHRQNVFV